MVRNMMMDKILICKTYKNIYWKFRDEYNQYTLFRKPIEKMMSEDSM